MKIAVISDIHSNLEALSTALRTIVEQEVDEIFCLGDVVGYGPDPAECVELVRKVCKVCLRGNHDEAVAMEQGVEILPKDGQAAARHNRQQLSPDQIDYLNELPYVHQEHNCTFVHATPKDPEMWIRFDSISDVAVQFEHMTTPICFIGHTHMPTVMADRIGVFRVRKGPRYIINCGSIGQPRDNDPRLSYGIFDTEEISYQNYRIDYDIKKTAANILRAGLPKRLSRRLFLGQ
jgi:predicted phosphodiesterase